MAKYRIIITLFWVVLSVVLLVMSYKLNLGEFHIPGPGLFPFLVCLLLLLVSSYALIKSILKKEPGVEAIKQKGNGRKIGKLGLVLISLFGYGVYFEKLGYLIATFVILVLLFWSMDSKRWTFVILSSVLVTLLTYYGFTYLGVRFPAGVLKGFLR